MSRKIIWHADPTVAARAVAGSFDAEVWGEGGPGDETGWAVFATGDPDPMVQGREDTMPKAKAKAEQFMRDAMGETL